VQHACSWVAATDRLMWEVVAIPFAFVQHLAHDWNILHLVRVSFKERNYLPEFL
jgi:hypothetical protein